MAKLDGTNGLIQQYDYQVLTTAFSYTFAAGTQTLIIDPAGTLATGTVTMPAAPADGMVITIQSSQQITALTLNGNTGQTIVGTAVQIVPNQPLSWVYRLANTTWYPFAGGAGRASPLVSGTAVASTSGVSIDFTSIPSWVKRITVMFQGVGTTGTSKVLIQLGDSGGIETSGYLGSVAFADSNEVATNLSSGFISDNSTNAAGVRHGAFIISQVDAAAFSYVCFGNIGRSDLAAISTMGGSKALSAVLDRVRITTVGGTETFDAGNINILYG